MADSTASPTADAAPAAAARPVLPDANLYKENLEKAQKAHQEVKDKLNAVKAKIALTSPNKSKDEPSPAKKRRDDLIAQLKAIREQQAGGKNARTAKQEQVKRLDEQLRSRISEQNAARSKLPYKSLEELNREIERKDRLVNSATLKAVEERKTLDEVSNLRRLAKGFPQLDAQQKQIDELKAKIKEIKDSMEDAQVKALSERYNKIQAELDGLKAEEAEARKGRDALYDERNKLQAEADEKWKAIKKLGDEYYGQKKAYDAYDKEQRQRAWERKKAERERIAQEQKMERAKKMLAEASDPAYLDEIRRAESILYYLDPTRKAPEKTPLLANSGLGAQPLRKIDASGIKGVPLARKEDRGDEYLPAAKKGKKGKKSAAADSTSKPFNCPPSVIEDCAFMGIDPPMNPAAVPSVIEKIEAKLKFWKEDQPEQTRKNIEKAKKEIERLEAEEAAGASGAATSNGANGKEDKAVV